MKTDTPEQLAREMVEAGSNDLEGEISAFIAMISTLRQRLTEDIVSKDSKVRAGSMVALKNLGAILKQATDTHLRLEAVAVKRARKMSHQDYLSAAMKLVLSSDLQTQKLWVRELLAKLDISTAKAEFLNAPKV